MQRKALAKLFCSLLVSAISISAYADYDQCILDSLAGVQSDRAAALIERSCREIFPKPDIRQMSSKLSDDQKQNLSGRGSIDAITKTFSGTLLNQNERIELTGILVGLYGAEFDSRDAEKYFVEVDVSPFDVSDFKFRVFSTFGDSKVNWTILEVWGKEY